eukprot:3381191-Alexandrium_andersonii.AAC.1
MGKSCLASGLLPALSSSFQRLASGLLPGLLPPRDYPRTPKGPPHLRKMAWTLACAGRWAEVRNLDFALLSERGVQGDGSLP